jgi:hypothetical protein
VNFVYFSRYFMPKKQFRRPRRSPVKLQEVTVRPSSSQLPPRLDASIRLSRTQRYYASQAGSFTLIINDLLDHLFLATAANAGYRLLTAIKINRVKIWGPPGTAAISLQWWSNTDLSGPAKLIEDVSLGSTYTPFINSRPPLGSLSASWLSTGASAPSIQLAQFNLPSGAIIDFHFSLVFQNTYVNFGGSSVQAPSPVTQTIGGATAGTVYVASLTGNSSSALMPGVYATA